MRIIEPKHFDSLPPVKKKRHYLRWFIVLLLIGGLVSAGYVGYKRFNRPLPDLVVSKSVELSAGPDVKYQWPDYGQSAVAIVGKGVIDSNNSQKPQPTASLAKVITALVVLDKKPLVVGQEGPSIAITKLDQQIYDKYYVINGSIVPVLPGTTLTQKELLEGTLIASANNMAETLTNWAFGSQEEYIRYANQYLEENNFKNTTVADSSGFSPKTVSTAEEMVRLGEMAMLDPVFAEIVASPQAKISNAGVIRSTNFILGRNGINGIKTGNTNEAGGCFMISVDLVHPDDSRSTVIAVVMGAKTVAQAMEDVQPLVYNYTESGFNDVAVVSEGQQLGVISSEWGHKAAVTATNDLSLFGWQQDQPNYELQIDQSDESGFADGQQLGRAVVELGSASGSVAVEQNGQINPPDFWWKFKRIFQR